MVALFQLPLGDSMSSHALLPGRTWIVVPTYNERDNLPPLVDAVLTQVPDAHLLVVDDNSPDGTGELADSLAASDERVAVLHRPGKAGLGAAYRGGFAEVLRDPECTRIVQMDCDFSHDPADVPRLLEALESCDLAIGSRNIRGGSTPGWSWTRRIISWGGSTVSRIILGMPVRDLTGGFKAWRREMLGQIDLENGYANGYGFQIEMTWTAHRLGARITEIPITFRERTAGVSKMSASIAGEALLMVLRLRLGAKGSAQPAALRVRDRS
jgi:dolichol-phosphate mannosyltransferase